MKRVILDIETNNLLEDMIDFSIPYPLTLKDTSRLWCISLRDFDDWDNVISLKKEECTSENLKQLLSSAEEIIFHNGLNFDMPALQLFGVIEYTVGFPGQGDTCFGRNVKFIDTLLLSQFLKPDRFGGHSAGAWGKYLGMPKIDFNAFHEFSEEMVIYCEQDTLTQAGIYKALLEELVHDQELYRELSVPFEMESKLVDLVIKQELRGFKFDVEHAESTLEKFIILLEDLQSKIDPELPSRPLNKGESDYYTPPVRQLLKNGNPSTYMTKFADKIGGELVDKDEEGWFLVFEKREYKLPFTECVKEFLPGSIHNLDYLKGYLLDLGWDPLEWKERDLTQDSKKNKLSDEKKEETIHRYVTSTLEGPYKEHRLKLIGVQEGQLLPYLLSKKDERVIKVPTGPCLRVGTEKALCPNLEALGEDAAFVTYVVEYLTFKHRKSSLAGGVEDEDGEPTKGFLSAVRADGRIGTPAATCGANGGRMKHRVVCNVPRVTSPGGEELRTCFGVDVQDDRIQFGFDFASLEAVMQGHYVMPFTNGTELAKSLTAEKPNDCFDLKTEILSNKGWIKSSEITFDTLLANWKESPTGLHTITYEKPTDIIRRDHEGDMIKVFNDRLDIKVTPNHILVVYNDVTKEYVSMEAKNLKWYVSVNTDCYIPSYGYSFDNTENQLEIDYSKIIFTNDKNSGMLYQSYDRDTIINIVTKQRLKGSSSLVIEKNGPKGTIYQTLVGKSPLNTKGFKLSFDAISTIKTNESVWCVTVPTNRVMVKRNNSIYVAGQCHSLNAMRLWGTLDKRNEAKSFSYACVPTDITEVLTLDGWKYRHELKATDIVYSYNSETDDIEVDVVRGIVEFDDKPIIVLSNGIDTFESTEDHRWYGLQHKDDLEYSFFTTKEITPDTVILNSRDGDTITESFGYEVINTLPSRPTFCITTNNSTFLIRQHKKYVSITGNCMYGAQPEKLAKMLRISLKEAEKLYESYWEGVPALKELKERLENYWRNTNKSYIKSIDGRKLYVRKQHSLVNLLLQSGGALVVKYTLMGVAKRLEELNLLGNPLVDTVETAKNKIYQLIIYHDEAQYDCPRSMFEFSDYYTEEGDAKAESKKHFGASAVSHNENGYYFVKSNLLSQIIEEEMFKVCFDLELKVSLSMEYNVGRNWAECH